VTWRRVKQVAVGLLLVAAVVELVRRRHELLSAVPLLAHPRYLFLGGAVLAEAASVFALARVEWLFLQPGGVHIRTTEMAELTAAHNAITMSVPGGVAWSTAFLFQQLRRRGADRTLAGWDVLISGATSSFCLFLVLAAGIELTEGGPTAAAKVPVAFLAAIPPVVAVVVVILHLRGMSYSDLVGWVADRLSRWKSARRWVLETSTRLRRYQPSPFQWGRAMAASMVNWLADLGCLVLCIGALHFHVPWPGVLVAYALAKVAGMLPITPGGLGVVEAGLTGLLAVYGMPASRGLAVSLLYRLISFWALLPVGWGYWFYLRAHTPARSPS